MHVRPSLASHPLTPFSLLFFFRMLLVYLYLNRYGTLFVSFGLKEKLLPVCFLLFSRPPLKVFQLKPPMHEHTCYTCVLGGQMN